MKQFRRGELVFDVVDSGPADGSVVVLLHGFPQSNASWDAVIPLLTARGYRCLAPNQRGYSPGARPERRRDYRMTELVDDVAALIDASGAEKVHLVGHDAGAGMGWVFAANHPDRLHTFTALSTPHPTAFKNAILTSRQGITSWYIYFYQLPRIPEWYYLGRRGDASRLSRYMQAGGQSPVLADRDASAMAEPGTLTASMNWYRALSWSDKIGQTTVPTMYVWSDSDKWVLDKAARNTGRYVSGQYRFEILHGTSHWIPEEQPDTVARLLLEWLETHSSP
ncbi:alpha/beta fold hydrolase [Mycobacterium sp. ACS4331]|uniref:alpha/beta fold hydrolase n=1 Tax=Mycobacterium sp. ACS4331 TaxID=1834121 RepID=UPI0012F81E73|nr:alpha/beta fold hydrolase [Mycobacterium sp. ACS4331]